MTGPSFMHGWATLLQSIAMIALILVAFGMMLGITKPGDAMKQVGAILGMVIVMTIAMGIMVSAWLGMAWWQQCLVIAIGICIWQWRRRSKPSTRRVR